MEKILQLNNEQIFQLMKRVIIDTNLWAFRLEELVEKKYDKSNYSQTMIKLNGEFGKRQANGLKKMGLITCSGLAAIEQALSYSHWSVLENFKIIKINDNTMRFGTVNCSLKKSMDSAGKEICCKETGTMIRQSFIELIEPNAKVSPVFTPGYNDNQESEFTCLWEVKLC